MGIVVSTEKEAVWIEGERRRQKYYKIITVLSFILLLHALVQCLYPTNTLTSLYLRTFLFAFLAFMVATLILTKSQRYLQIIDELLAERNSSVRVRGVHFKGDDKG